MDEQAMTALMDEVGDALAPDVAALVAGAAARGRRRRRRHSIGAGAAGVAALAVLGGVAWTVVPGSDGPGRSVVAADPTQTPTRAQTPSPGGPRQFAPDPAKTGWLLAEQVEGRVTRVRSHHGDQLDGPYQAGTVLLDGALVSVMLQHTELPRCGEQPRGATCIPVDGGYLSTATYDEPSPGGQPSGIVQSTATYFTADHFAVTVTAWNAPQEKGAAPVLPDPVLSEQQAARIARDEVWLEQHQ